MIPFPPKRNWYNLPSGIINLKMLSEGTEPLPIGQKMANFLLHKIPIESSQRSRAHKALICLYYALDYAILWAVNGTLLNTQPPVLSLTLPFFLARLLTSLAFILSKAVGFFALNKLAIAAELLLTTRQPLYQQLINVLVQLAMCGVWTLTKQQRMVHFDSKMGLKRTFLKQFSICLCVLGSNVLQQGNNKETIFFLTIVMLMIYWCDSTEFYYTPNTQRNLVRLDQMMLVLYLATLLDGLIGLAYQQYLFVSAALLLISLIQIAQQPATAPRLLTTPLNTLCRHNEREVAEYFLQVKNMLLAQSHQQLQSFTLKMQQELQSTKLLQKLASAKQQGVEAQRQAVDQYIIRELKRESEHSCLLRDLLLYMYLPDRRVYSYLELKNSHHRREYQRILEQRSVVFVNESYEASRQLEQAKRRLFSCSDITRRFYRQLMKERINLERTLDLGKQYLSILHMFISENAASMQRTPRVSLLIAKYTQLCLPHYFLQKMAENNADAGSAEKEAMVVIGTEEQSIGLIMHVNVSFMKLASITRRGSQKQSFCSVVPKELHAYIRQLMGNKCGKQQGEELLLAFAWVVNSLGNIVCCGWHVKQTFYASQRCLELSMVPILVEKAVLVVDEAGHVLGVSELARYFGFLPNSEPFQFNQQILQQLLTNEQFCISKNANPVTNEFYAAPQNYNLVLINTVNIPYFERKIYVVELAKQGKRDLLKTATFNHQRKAIDFQFHFSWTGKITTQPFNDVLPVSKQEGPRVEVNYGEFITEMRFFRETIDYKSNFEREEERDCPSLPRQLEESLPNINEAQFYENWQRKREKTPTWFRLAVVLIVLAVLASIGLISLLLLNFNRFAQLQTNNLTYFCKLYQKLQAIIKLATLTTFPKLWPPQNTTQLINAQLTLSSTLSSELYSIAPSAFSQTSGQALIQQLSTLNLYINNYLQNSPGAAKDALTLVTQIIPNFYNYIDGLMASNSREMDTNSNMEVLVIAAFAVIVAVIILLLWVLQYRLGQQQNEIVDVLKSLDNDYLSAASGKVERFKQVWLQENEVADYEQQDPQGAQQKHNYSKHAVSDLRVNLSKPTQVLWFAATLMLVLLMKTFAEQLQSTASQYATLSACTFKHITALHQTWALFNLNPGLPALNAQIAFTFAQEYKKILALRDISLNPLVGLAPFYLNFWERQTFCTYIGTQDCPTLLGLGTHQGASVVVSFLSQQYDTYLNYASNLSMIYAQPDVKKSAQIIFFYLDAMINANAVGFLQDYSAVVSTLWDNVVLGFSLSMVSALLLLLFIAYYKRLHSDHLSHQEILMLVPFDKLKSSPAFHRFYNRRFASA